MRHSNLDRQTNPRRGATFGAFDQRLTPPSGVSAMNHSVRGQHHQGKNMKRIFALGVVGLLALAFSGPASASSMASEGSTTLNDCGTLNLNVSTNIDRNGWKLKGATYVDGGIRLDVTGGWDEATITRKFDKRPLADLGDVVSFTASPEQYAGIHLLLSNGHYLTYEPIYGGLWWSNYPLPVPVASSYYATLDTLANIVAANPTMTVSKIVMLYTSPDVASSIVTDVTVGCTKYTFDYTDRK